MSPLLSSCKPESEKKAGPVKNVEKISRTRLLSGFVVEQKATHCYFAHSLSLEAPSQAARLKSHTSLKLQVVLQISKSQRFNRTMPQTFIA